MLVDVFWKFTPVNCNSCRVVEDMLPRIYTVKSLHLYGKVSTLEVLSLTIFSDHKPHNCKVKASASTVDTDILFEALEDAPRKYKRGHDDENTHY